MPTVEETKQVLIDYYINLLRIKADEKGDNKELERQIQIAKIKMTSFDIDISSVEKMF